MKIIDDKMVLGKVARLLEFYSGEELHRFFHVVEVRGLDIAESFDRLDNIVMEHLSRYGMEPLLDEAVSVFWLGK